MKNNEFRPLGHPFLFCFSYNLFKQNNLTFFLGFSAQNRKGLCEFNALLKKSEYSKVSLNYDFDFLFKKKRTNNVFIMLLPIPTFRNNFFDYNTPNYSYVSTELLYLDENIPINNRKYPSKNDTSVFSFKGRKNNFVTKIKNSQTNVDFSGFKPVFEVLHEIFNIETT